MSVVMLILKIIGILFLLVTFAVALVLFFPLSYRARGEFGDEAKARGAVWWLFGALRLEFFLQSGGADARFYIFRFSKSKRNPDTEDIETEDSGENELEEDFSEPEDAGENDPEEGVSGTEESGENESEEGVFETESSGGKEPGEAILESEASKGGGTDSRKSKKPKRAADKRVKTGRAACARREISDPGNRQAAAHIWRELAYLLSRAKPKNIQADISFCAGDPALTGLITGVISLFPFIYRFGAHICPDFVSNDFYVRGSFALRGHMAAFHFARSLFRLVRDKNVRKLYHKVI